MFSGNDFSGWQGSCALQPRPLRLRAGLQRAWVTLRSVPRNPLGDELQLTSWSGPQPTPRTMQLLRVYNLTDALQGDSRTLLENLQRITDQEPSADKVYAMSELAYLSARKVEKQDQAQALDLYGAAVLHAYAFLFDDRLAATRNCYDPQFRGACDLYNGALESALRLSCDHGELRPGTIKTIHTAAGTWDITCVLRGGVWQPEDFDHFEFVSDYEMKGLKNHYQTHGLGVPLIVVRRSYKGEPEAARYYPPGLSFPVTAFLRPVSGPNPAGRNQGLLELCDPLEINDTRVGRLLVPLESDLTTPLAYFLSKVPMESLATVGLFHPEQLLTPRGDQQSMIKGLYMVQPYEPGKIPGRFHPRHVVEPDDLDGDVQRPAELARHSPALPVLVLSLSHRPAVLAQRGPVAPRPGRDAASARSAASRAGPGPDGAGGPQHGRPGRAAANAGERAGLLETGQPHSLGTGQGRPRGAAEARRDVLFPSQSVDPPRGDHRHAARRQQRSPTRRRNTFWAS